uniref:Transposase Tc1-like domain-containing protein n=1 Tax=Pygocentrus nattereri TaxID=42514 RepID=A0AAR2KT31_PYGNA
MGKKGDLSDFERGVVVGARRAGLKTADLLRFSLTTVSRVYREWSEKEKIYSERQSCGQKCLVDVRGQRRMGRLKMGYSSRRPHRVPLLSAKNKKLRLQFAWAHQNRTMECWKNVAWSDDSSPLLVNLPQIFESPFLDNPFKAVVIPVPCALLSITLFL